MKLVKVILLFQIAAFVNKLYRRKINKQFGRKQDRRANPILRDKSLFLAGISWLYRFCLEFVLTEKKTKIFVKLDPCIIKNYQKNVHTTLFSMLHFKIRYFISASAKNLGS